ncbi:metalloregulator ArsR/SmtB family transcription factor [Suttonella sp. R2A3]|uniref:ArsR/SmtB family transcription factor n=1 Tax=Suttonella sp. R2A3 TaxID=2908648 RepID=UPI001F38903A|nr:metalloregulator ArsR/SmtB family transcription factor [Suttonella sp. R2A3]UJF24157.1 metalloregulator ArsR/SmtB family transcription factor [Suttonella sp. R2A3]
MDAMLAQADEVSQLLKLIANKHRLMALCALVEQPRNVTELIEIVGIAQTSMSNHLAILREANIVDFTRDHRTLTYYISNDNLQIILATLHGLYCSDFAKSVNQ